MIKGLKKLSPTRRHLFAGFRDKNTKKTILAHIEMTIFFLLLFFSLVSYQ